MRTHSPLRYECCVDNYDRTKKSQAQASDYSNNESYADHQYFYHARSWIGNPQFKCLYHDWDGSFRHSHDRDRRFITHFVSEYACPGNNCWRKGERGFRKYEFRDHMKRKHQMEEDW